MQEPVAVYNETVLDKSGTYVVIYICIFIINIIILVYNIILILFYESTNLL